MARCNDCSFAYCVDRDLPDDTYEKAYSSLPGYKANLKLAGSIHSGTEGLRQLGRYKRRAVRQIPKSLRGGSLLDVGCGPGCFMLAMQQRGWEVKGLELAANAVERARGFGLDVAQGDLESLIRNDDVKQAFDVISMFEVLEHLQTPVETLRQVRTLMKPSSVLLMSLPNSDDPYCLVQQDPASMPPVHLNFFNRRSLNCAFKLAGLTMSYTYTYPVPTNSARRVLGKPAFYRSLPILLLKRIFGCSDGTTLVAVASRSDDKP